MLPRKNIDLTYADLAFGLIRCLRPYERTLVQFQVQAHWGAAEHVAVALSVRTGFDALLQSLRLPPGSEILVSAITIRDMVSIIEHHGLRPLSVDVSPHAANITAAQCARALTSQTRAVLVAHLFGARMPLDDIAEFARAHGLLLIEDCAQAYAADGYTGHAQSDVAMFSFGTIKTATALGGGVLCMREVALCAQLKQVLSQYPVQPQSVYAKKILKTTLLKCLSQPVVYGLFAKACALLGLSHDAIVSKAVRGFAGGNLMQKLRQQPCAALLAVMERRFARGVAVCAQVRARAESAAAFQARIPHANQVAAVASGHTYWVFPLQSRAPDALVADLQCNGIDAARGASSMIALNTGNASHADALMREMLYLPDALAQHTGEQARALAVIAAFNTRIDSG